MDNTIILRLLELLRLPSGAGRLSRRDLVRLAVVAIEREATSPWTRHTEACGIWSGRALGRRCTCGLEAAEQRAAARAAELWAALGEPSDNERSLAALEEAMNAPKSWQRRGRRRR